MHSGSTSKSVYSNASQDSNGQQFRFWDCAGWDWSSASEQVQVNQESNAE